MSKFSIAVVILILFNANVIAQKLNNVWCFGNDAKITFTNGTAIADSTKCNSRGTCVSICDSLGNLLFYAAGSTDGLSAQYQVGGKAYNKENFVMQNGDSITAGRNTFKNDCGIFLNYVSFLFAVCFFWFIRIATPVLE